MYFYLTNYVFYNKIYITTYKRSLQPYRIVVLVRQKEGETMRILVLSDTHYKTDGAEELLEELNGQINAVIHLGDNTADAAFIKQNYSMPVFVVAGNCDTDDRYPNEMVVKLRGKIIFITHGHRYGVNYGMEKLIHRAQQCGADVCLFGHTHIPYVEIADGMVIMNPGSLSKPRGGSQPSYGIIKIEDEKIYPIIVPYI